MLRVLVGANTPEIGDLFLGFSLWQFAVNPIDFWLIFVLPVLLSVV